MTRNWTDSSAGHRKHIRGDEIEMFRDVFYTMQETDVAGWVRSLQLRGINLPDDIKDEVFLIIGERRIHP